MTIWEVIKKYLPILARSLSLDLIQEPVFTNATSFSKTEKTNKLISDENKLISDENEVNRPHKTVPNITSAISKPLDYCNSIALRNIKTLLGFILKMTSRQVFLNHNKQLTQDELEIFQNLVDRLLNHEPISYIVGFKPFFESDFVVNPNVLIPRDDSEILVETVIKDIKSNYRYDEISTYNKNVKIFEFGVGSGCLILSIIKHLNNNQYKNISGIGIENSENALQVAKINQEKLSIYNVNFFNHDWNIKTDFEKCDIIISNPPYISKKEILHSSVVNYEPSSALFADEDGLKDYLTILDLHQNIMKPNCIIYFELGAFTIAPLLEKLKLRSNFMVIGIIKDLGGIDRILKLQYLNQK